MSGLFSRVTCYGTRLSQRIDPIKLDDAYEIVRQNRFKDIVVIKTKFDSNPSHFILASSFNKRHLVNGTLGVNKEFKLIRPTGISISAEWNVIDLETVVVHLMSQVCRERFDIEQLWAVGESYDDQIHTTVE